MYKINSVQDLIDVLQYVQREWGNDSNIKYLIKEKDAFRDDKSETFYGHALYAYVGKDGSVTISNSTLYGDDDENDDVELGE